MKEKLVRMFGFVDNEIVTIVLSSPFLVYVIAKHDELYFLYACRIDDNVSRICLKCGTYDEMFACVDMLRHKGCYKKGADIIYCDVNLL